MIENMTKKDLKERMVVETRNGNRYLVCGNSIIRDKGYCNFRDYNENLTSTFSELDIVKVYSVVSTLEEITSSNLYLLWKRKEHTPEVGDVYIDDNGNAIFIYQTVDDDYYYAFEVYENEGKLTHTNAYYNAMEFSKFKFVENKPSYVASLQQLMMAVNENKNVK